MKKAVALSSGESGNTTPTAKLVCTALPAPGKPARDASSSRNRSPHSPRICSQHPFSTGLWKIPVHGLCSAWVLREGEHLQGVFGLGFARVTVCFHGMGHHSLFEWDRASPLTLLWSSPPFFHDCGSSCTSRAGWVLAPLHLEPRIADLSNRSE